MTQAEREKALLGPGKLPGVDALLVPANRRCAESAWADVFEAGPDTLVVSIGNVAGSGDTGGLMRAVRDACAPANALAPAGLLAAADAVLRSAASQSALATAIIGVIDRTAATFSYVCAGHPPPFVRYPDGSVAVLPADGLPIGLAESPFPPASVVVDLAGASLLVLYSSMLVHATKDVADGLLRLRDVLADERMAHCSSPAPWVARRMLSGCSHDDVALLTVDLARRPGVRASMAPPWTVAWSFDATAAASNGARRAFMSCLKSRGDAAQILDLTAAELIFGELMGNVVRHAPGPVEIILDWTGTLPVLHVLDSGPGFESRRKRERLPDDDWSESGRGLFIVNACARDFALRNREVCGTHASATLPPP